MGQLSLGYEHAFGDLSTTSIGDVGVGGILIDETAEIDQNRLLIGVGMTFGQGAVQGYARYDGVFGQDSHRHSGALGYPTDFKRACLKKTRRVGICAPLSLHILMPLQQPRHQPEAPATGRSGTHR